MTSFITPSPQTAHESLVSSPDFPIPHSASAPVNFDERDGPAMEKSWLRLVGLPFNATESDILGFVSGFAVGTSKPLVIFAPTRGSRGCDRAFIRMASAAEAHRAEGALHGKNMKSRFIEARRVAMRHVMREIKNGPNQTQDVLPPQPKVLPGPMFAPTAPFQQIQQNLPLPMGHCVTLVGLPWNCPPQNILSFLKFPPVRALHICGNRGDKCIVELSDTNEVARIAKQFHRQHLGGRYIEVYAARPCDMRCSCHPGSILVATPHGGLVPLPMLDMVLAGCLPTQFPIAPAPGFSTEGRMGWMPQPTADYRAMSPSGSEMAHTASMVFTSAPSFSSLSAVDSCQRNSSNETSSDEDDLTVTSECKSEEKEEEKEEEPYKTGPVFVHDPYNLPAVAVVEEVDMDDNSDDNTISEDREDKQTNVVPPKMSSAEDWAAEDDDDYEYSEPNNASEEGAMTTAEESEPKQWDLRGGAASPTNSGSSSESRANVAGDVEGQGNSAGGSAAHLPAYRSPKRQQRPPLPQGMPGVPPFGAYFVPPMMMPIMPMAMPWPMHVPNVNGRYNGHNEHTCTCQQHGKGSFQRNEVACANTQSRA